MAPSDPLPDIELANYRFLSVLGRGGMGSVYLAEQQNPRRQVAIKIVAPNDDVPRAVMDVLKNEGDIAAGFEHDHLAHVYECGIVDDHYYLAMQYLAGGDLDGRLREAMSLDTVRTVIRAIASALGHIHQRGFVHRDIKPGNILFTADGKPVLADFGIAKATDSVGLMTSAGYSTGTPAYMSPEQVRGETLDGRSDLYSLGIVLYECLTGQLPFLADNEHDLRELQVRGEAPPLPASVARLQPVVDRLLAKRPEDRYRDAEALIADLDAIGRIGDQVTLAKPATPASPSGRAPSEPASEASPVTVWVREMSQRRVFRALALYVALAWGLSEIVAGVVERVPGVPDSLATLTTLAFLIGLPIVIFLAWRYDFSAAGLRRAPAGRRGLMLVSVSIAAVLSASWIAYQYLPKEIEAPPDEPVSPETQNDLTLAVLPFQNLSMDDATAYLGRVIPEDLLSGISVIPGVKVKATYSSFSLAGQPLQDVGSRLAVNRVVDGSFSQSEQGLRVSARMLDPATGEVLWSETFRDELSDIFELQAEMARAIARAMGRTHPSESVAVKRRIDPEAFRRLNAGMEAMVNPFRDTEPAIEEALQILEIEPDYPEALAWLGGLYTGRAWIAQDRESPALISAEGYLLKALELDPNLAMAYGYRGLNLAVRYRWSEARAMIDRAVELNGQQPLPMGLTAVYNNLGHKHISLGLEEAQFERDPLNPRSYRGLLGSLVWVGEDERALQMVQLAREQGIPINEWPLTPVYARAGDLEKAIAIAPYPPEMAAAFVNAVLTGRDPQLEAALDQARSAQAMPLGDIIWGYMVAGADEDKVFPMARQAWQDGQLNQIAFFHPSLSRYRADPRFVSLMEDMGLADYWRTVEAPDFCRDDPIEALCGSPPSD